MASSALTRLARLEDSHLQENHHHNHDHHQGVQRECSIVASSIPSRSRWISPHSHCLLAYHRFPIYQCCLENGHFHFFYIYWILPSLIISPSMPIPLHWRCCWTMSLSFRARSLTLCWSPCWPHGCLRHGDTCTVKVMLMLIVLFFVFVIDCCQSRFILMESMMIFLGLASLLCVLKFRKISSKPFTTAWFTWLRLPSIKEPPP